MSHRLSEGGALIDRDRPVRFSFNGRQMQGFEGDTLASALLANGQMLVGRSFKYHRPRGLIASGIEEPNGLMTLGTGTRSEPNRVATTTELFEGLVARSQNHWPSLEHDFGAAASLAARFLPAGFYYKTFIHPRPAWKHLFEPVIRRSAGLGPAPVAADPDTYEHFYHFTDVLVVGGGIAGLTAARAAAETGARVTLLEQAPHWGGRALTDLAVLGNGSVSDWVRAELAALQAMANVTLRNRTMAAGVYDHGYVLAHERITDHRPDPCGPRHRLWRIRAGRIVLAAGALERPLAFAGNDLPGVMLASAMRDYVGLWGVAPGRRVALVTNNDDAYRSALALRRAGCEVPVILDVRPAIAAPLLEEARAHDLRVALGRGVARVRGSDRVESIEICAVQGEGMAVETVVCDALAMSGGWSPAVHLWSHCGGRLVWDEARACFRPDPDRPPTGADGAGFVIAAGSANGEPGTAAVLRDAASAGRRAAAELGFTPAAERPLPAVDEPGETAPEPVWIMPAAAPPKLREKAFLDFQNDVKVSDIQLAAREGYANVEHAKRYTTLGMATDQGKLSNINGLGVLADARGLPIPQVGTTTFRPPYANYSFGAIAGAARGPLFKPIRRAVTDGWAEARGAVFEPVGDWRRAFAYPRPGESVEAAVQREARLVRSGVGLLDASTLGKILVAGPDAATLLDRIYTNMMSSLKPGRCRYGLMCTENGFVFDDGVVARLDEQTFLCHTTTGGAERVHGHLEEWLQTEWWDLKAFTLNVTEQHAQIGVVGPQARELLGRLGLQDLSDEALPFMSHAEREVAGIPARVLRVSFSGELSFELSVPAARGLELWEALIEAGATPYGTEAMHILRAEKGFIIVGDETDGTVTPHDLGMSWIVSKKKPDFIGKRALERSFLVAEGRKQLVGLETLEPGRGLPDGAHAVEGTRANGKPRMLGHVTSTYFSPTLGRHIAMGLIADGRRRMGSVLEFSLDGGEIMQARVVDPCFLSEERRPAHV